MGDGERLTGTYALGPEAGEWLQQATLAIRAEVAAASGPIAAGPPMAM